MKLLPLILLASCTYAPIDTSQLDLGPHTFQLHFVDRILYANRLRRGLKVYDPKTDIHHIYIPKDDYPGCLGHEVVHILDKDFHKGRDSVEYCVD